MKIWIELAKLSGSSETYNIFGKSLIVVHTDGFAMELNIKFNIKGSSFETFSGFETESQGFIIKNYF